jgi:hypothetical protein
MRIVPRLSKETTMRKRIKTQTVEQLNLFVPPPQRPTWERLPAPVQRKVTELLAELLGERKSQNAKPANAKETADE